MIFNNTWINKWKKPLFLVLLVGRIGYLCQISKILREYTTTFLWLSLLTSWVIWSLIDWIALNKKRDSQNFGLQFGVTGLFQMISPQNLHFILWILYILSFFMRNDQSLFVVCTLFWWHQANHAQKNKEPENPTPYLDKSKGYKNQG